MKRQIFGFFALVSLVALSSCKDSYLDINTDPNNAATSTPNLVLPTALNVSASRLAHHEVGAFWSGQWSPTGSVSGFAAQKTYALDGTFGAGTWASCYDNLNDYNYIEQVATEKKMPAFVGIAKVMEAFNFAILVDVYGNIPYSDALKGTASIRPTYDQGPAIYEDLIKRIDAGIAEMNKPISSDNPSPGTSDIYCKGNMTKWVRFANTLKLRLLLRQVNMSGREAYIRGEIAKISGGFLAAGEDITSDPGFLKTSGKMNPFYANYGFTEANIKSGNKDFYTYGAFFIGKLLDFRDPRGSRLAYVPEDAAFRNSIRGVPFGEGNDAYTAAKISAFGPAFLPTLADIASSELFKRPQPVMLASEAFFLQAEAAQRGFTAGNAQTLYETGIAESFRYLGVPTPAAALTTYLAQTTVNTGWAASPNKLEAIITQKWIASANVNGFEAWCDFRRTGFPAVPLSTRAQGNQHPARWLYPVLELGTNPENVKAQGEVTAFTKLFWAK